MFLLRKDNGRKRRDPSRSSQSVAGRSSKSRDVCTWGTFFGVPGEMYAMYDIRERDLTVRMRERKRERDNTLYRRLNLHRGQKRMVKIHASGVLSTHTYEPLYIYTQIYIYKYLSQNSRRKKGRPSRLHPRHVKIIITGQRSRLQSRGGDRSRVVNELDCTIVHTVKPNLNVDAWKLK